MTTQSRILIKGGKVVNEDFSEIADVYIEDGVISAVGSDLQVAAGTRVHRCHRQTRAARWNRHSHTHGAVIMGTTAVDDFHTGTKVNTICASITIHKLIWIQV